MTNPKALAAALMSLVVIVGWGCAGPPIEGESIDEGEGEGEGEGESAGEGEGEAAGEGEGEGEAAGEGEGEDPTPPPTCPGAPQLSHPCLAEACGNEIGVGVPCSEGGGECGDFSFFGGEAWVCTVDFVADASLHMCTRPCSEDGDCGGAAVCTGDPRDPDSDKGCVPDACAGP